MDTSLVRFSKSFIPDAITEPKHWKECNMFEWMCGCWCVYAAASLFCIYSLHAFVTCECFSWTYGEWSEENLCVLLVVRQARDKFFLTHLNTTSPCQIQTLTLIHHHLPLNLSFSRLGGCYLLYKAPQSWSMCDNDPDVISHLKQSKHTDLWHWVEESSFHQNYFTCNLSLLWIYETVSFI